LFPFSRLQNLMDLSAYNWFKPGGNIFNITVQLTSYFQLLIVN